MHLLRHGCLGLNDALCCFARCAQTTPFVEQQEVLLPSFSVLLPLFSQGCGGKLTTKLDSKAQELWPSKRTTVVNSVQVMVFLSTEGVAAWHTSPGARLSDDASLSLTDSRIFQPIHM